MRFGINYISTISDDRVVYVDIVGVLDVNSIGVGTGRGCFDVKGIDVDVVAAVEPEMELRAVLYLDSFHHQVWAPEKP